MPDRSLWLVLPAFLYVAHASAYGGWIVDDAGISFAYARNLAAGHGWVAQPGLAPVEGFSNPLWVLLCAALSGVGAFDPILAPKGLALACTLATLWTLTRIAATVPAGVLAGCLLVLCPSYVIWSVSGLENALTALLVALLCAAVQRESAPAVPAIALALVRPEGIVFVGLLVLARQWRELGFAVVGIGFTIGVRLAVFGAWLPNTWHAKGSLPLTPQLALAPLVAFAAVAGIAGFVLALAVAAEHGSRLNERRVLVGAVLIGVVVYVVLPRDWMGEFRFATPLLVPFFVLLAESTLRSWHGPQWRRVVVGLAAVGLLLHWGQRMDRFRRAPTVPLVLPFAERVDAAAARVGATSILAADVGGLLWASELRVIDLAGLTDVTIARTARTDPDAFLDYVFAQEPDFIELHGDNVRNRHLRGSTKLRERYRVVYDVDGAAFYVRKPLYDPALSGLLGM